MKNIKIKVLIAIVLLIAIIPFGYRQYINRAVVAQVNRLSDKGFMVVKQSDNSGFLTTKQSYKLIISDPQKIYSEFFSHLFSNAQGQIVEKFIDLLNGGELTLDINILNFPVNHQKALGIYFTKLPTKLVTKQNKDIFLSELSLFLKNRGFGETVNLNAMGKITSIDFKDIDKKFDGNHNSIKIEVKKYKTLIKRVKLSKSNYALTVKNQYFNFKTEDRRRRGSDLSWKNLKCDIDRKDLFNYSTICSVDDFSLKSKKYKTSELKLNGIFFSGVSKDINNTLSYSYKHKIKNINLQVQSTFRKNNFNVNNFIYQGTLEGINKELIKKLSGIAYARSSYLSNRQIKDLFLHIINNGLRFKIDRLSIDSLKITGKNSKLSLGKIKIDLDLKVMKNKISFKGRRELFNLLKSIKLKSSIKLSEKDFNTLLKTSRNRRVFLLQKLAKHKAGNVIFDIKYENTHLTINNQKM